MWIINKRDDYDGGKHRGVTHTKISQEIPSIEYFKVVGTSSKIYSITSKKGCYKYAVFLSVYLSVAPMLSSGWADLKHIFIIII